MRESGERRREDREKEKCIDMGKKRKKEGGGDKEIDR